LGVGLWHLAQLSGSLGQYSAVFQAETENLETNYRNREAERSRIRDLMR
jgi:hypothetical protein